MSTTTWNPQSWRNFSALQQPSWPEPAALEQTLKILSDQPPLVFAGEARDLQDRLAAAGRGEAFLLQAGDCAESFESSADSIRDRLRVILQMAVVLTYAGRVPVVKVGRIAGQFAKPRSSDTETQGELELPSFRGHIINDIGFSETERRAEPNRLLMAYNRAAATLNLVRAFTRGGFADLTRVHQWNQEFVADSPQGAQYEKLAQEIDRSLQFMRSCGIDLDRDHALNEVDFYTSHEALILDYEEALTRLDSLTDEWYDCSAHMLWIGERTRQLDGAHVEFLRGVKNPLGCKIGPTATVEDVVGICEALNPDKIEGRVTLITRMGAENIREKLPPLLAAVKETGHPVVWVSDPMHGNTFTAPGGHKTRHFDAIVDEITGFFESHEKAGTIAGGIHLELTGDAVTECLGGGDDLTDDELSHAYETMCDPRLNGRQGLDVAFRVADLLAAR
ncbi:MAG: 3-deoxy-7-phosphoheptulonate synthase class II [Acidimicrobiales bacterium]|nr:3-deoxy-7-phosphoheptulonate synthase class II [Acidimicrobiales bacterium]RZV45991.1 MAG: 3-deoxy-7-phosphoheptulonate synthase class II [Acidimicrobiales bacterium]